MMSQKASECRKFSPNIFNPSKCQNCFKGKDAHSPEALESNRATRKVSCRGYLFVAPDWDFSLAANRNKRWQRRWFVLYDDGELAYSVDEHPETVPQCVIDMTRVLEVCDAEAVTGNAFALALACADKVHFVKATAKDEAKRWFEVLSKFPRNTVCGKYKRSATFPCLKAAAPSIKVDPVRRDTVDGPRLQSDPGDTDIYPTRDTDHQEKPDVIQIERSQEERIIPPIIVPELVPERTIHKSASVPDAVLRDKTQVRGDPDGCNPDSLPPAPPSSESEQTEPFLKKGWLVQQGEEGWRRHWFVLRNCALASYADPAAEEAGVLDSLLDLRQAACVSPAQDLSFAIQMKDGRRLLLSAVTAKVRAQWVRALAPASPPPPRSALSRAKERARARNAKPPEQEEWSTFLSKFCRSEEVDKPSNTTGLQAAVRAAQAQADGLELESARLRQAAAQAERLHASQMALMAARVEDLTAKLLAAERQVRQLRQRVAKLETRRRSSLKGKEALTLSKEFEAKLSELEAKMGSLAAEAPDSLLGRLHALDARVDARLAASAPPAAAASIPRLQVNAASESWTPPDAFEELRRRLSELREWLRGVQPGLPDDDAQLRWLQSAHDALYRQAHFQQYRGALVLGRLRRVEVALEGLEQFMEQHPPTLSLCALASRISTTRPLEQQEEEELRRRVGELRGRVRGAVAQFKLRSIERLCAALRELAEEKEAAQSHFLAHVVAQVARAFDDKLARTLFPWQGGGAAQRALAQLSAELRELRVPPGGCGVLLEFARCSVEQLARLVAMAALAEDAAQHAEREEADEEPSEAVGGVLCGAEAELGACHRSVASLLCFKRNWKERHCRSCTELRQEVSYLQGELEESRAVSGALCQQQEIQYNEEKKTMEKELQVAKSNLKKMELRHEEELRRLRREQETQRLRYADEMEQLKGLCERGLCALEAAHQGALRELERRHQAELQERARERERALAQEARATALALEAVRRAHAEELQERRRSGEEEERGCTEAFRKCYEADLGQLKIEILRVAEKYSAKCLECAALRERLEASAEPDDRPSPRV